MGNENEKEKNEKEERQKRIDSIMSNDAERLGCNGPERFRQHDNHEIYMQRIPTGYKLLDETLGGGLIPGVYYIGAMSSLGKSTFCLQMADNLASRGQKVVYASLEMKKDDMLAKLISMYTFLDVAPKIVPPGSGGSVSFNAPEVLSKAKSATDLRSADSAAKNTPGDWELIDKCSVIVEKHGKNISFLESISEPITVDYLDMYLDGYVQKYGITPVVFIDYMQILAPSETVGRCTDKQIADYNVSKLRMMASRLNTPIIVISSFNRASYNSTVSMSDFKETGSIEYSADALIGLQLKGVGDRDFDVNEAKAKHPREVELVVIKQRYGRCGDLIDYLYSATYNYFDELPHNSAPKSDFKKCRG